MNEWKMNAQYENVKRQTKKEKKVVKIKREKAKENCTMAVFEAVLDDDFPTVTFRLNFQKSEEPYEREKRSAATMNEMRICITFRM